MVVKVLVVDDSSFFRRRVSEIINQDPTLEVIDTAQNGREAVEKAMRLQPDVITMDIEMPVMDGISAVREIMAKCPTPTLMFSSLTHDGAKATLDALDAGALDFLPKKFEDIARDKEEAIKLLQQRVKAIARRRLFMSPARSAVASTGAAPAPTASSGSTLFSSVRSSTVSSERSSVTATPAASAPVNFKKSGKSYQLVAIGTSTGGPVALQAVLTQLPANFPHPILLIQHMPATFTAAFAARLNGLCQISVKEAEDGDLLRPGAAYLAPGGKQMMIDGRGQIKILPGDERLNYKPCVDITFGSAAKSYGDKVLAVVLTGMGADGREGARLLKQGGSTVWAQDEASCVIYGMPMAVVKANLADAVYGLDDIGRHLAEACI